MANMIEVTVKTLDSQNHVFTVSEDVNVLQFKTEISPTVGIPPDQQRLIFRGRVLQDEKSISEYNVGSQTIHLVQRSAAHAGSRANDEPRPRTTTDNAGGMFIGGQPNIIMGSIGIPAMDITIGDGTPGGARRQGAAARLQNGNAMLNRASNLLQTLEEVGALPELEASEDELPPIEVEVGVTGVRREQNPVGESPMDISDPNNGDPLRQMLNFAESQAVAVARAIANPQSLSTAPNTGVNASGNSNGTVQLPGATLPPQSRPESPRLREMAIAIQDLLAFHQRLNPYLQYLQNQLRANQDYLDTAETQSVQFVFDTVSSILHLLSHSYHSYSDLICDFSRPAENRRLRAALSVVVEQSTVVRASFPVALQGMQAMAAMVGSGNQAVPPVPPSPSSVPVLAPTAVPATTNDSSTQQPQQSQPQVQSSNVPFPHGISIPAGPGHPGLSINFQSNAQVADLSSVLGPAVGMTMGMPAGMMPFLAGIAQQGHPVPAAQSGSNTAGTNVNVTTSSQTTRHSGASYTQAGSINANGSTSTLTDSNPNMSAGNGPLPNNLRADVVRPFDLLMSCSSHHATRRRPRIRPQEFERYVNLPNMSGDEAPTPDSSPDVFESYVNILRYSSILEMLQPVLKDVIQNYLLRGRDFRNIEHVKTSAKTFAKKSLPFLMAFSDKVVDKKSLDYSQTYFNVVTKFFTEMFRLCLRAEPCPEFRNAFIRLCEELLGALMGIFRFSFSETETEHTPSRFAKAIIDHFLDGSSINLRRYLVPHVTSYLTSLDVSDAASLDRAQKRIVRIKETNVAEPGPSSSSTPGTSNTESTSENATTEAKAIVSTMDADIDDMIQIPQPRHQISQRQQLPSRPRAVSENIPGLQHLPTEWIDTVQHDMRRQLGMSEQVPFSPGYTALFPRKH